MRFRARNKSARSRAFTLIEVAIAIAVVGMGVVAVQSMVAASTRATAINDEVQTATMLARAMHERCLNLDRTALRAMDDAQYSPPVDSQAQQLAELKGYKQRVDIDNVDPTSLSGTSNATDTGLLRVTVTVSRNDRTVLSTHRLLATTKQE